MSEFTSYSGSGDSSRLVPKKLLDDAHEASERLRQKLDEVVSSHKRDHEEAVRALQYQLKTVQGQYRTLDSIRFCSSWRNSFTLFSASRSLHVSTEINQFREKKRVI